MYQIILQLDDPEWGFIQSTAARAVEALGEHQKIWWMPADSDRSRWELQFGDLRSLHTFCVLMGRRAQAERSEIALRVGEFVMWTLGFRWV
jgi:hypothetical protein